MKAEGVLNILSKVTLKCQKQDLKPVRLASVSHIFHHFSKLSLVEIVGDGAFPRMNEGHSKICFFLDLFSLSLFISLTDNLLPELANLEGPFSNFPWNLATFSMVQWTESSLGGAQ